MEAKEKSNLRCSKECEDTGQWMRNLHHWRVRRVKLAKNFDMSSLLTSMTDASNDAMRNRASEVIPALEKC
eukprot:m.461809 g.461809  ORF g.461809 m.461809 type:complete len:71 (+) comp22414_c0_seq1:41-253(+)